MSDHFSRVNFIVGTGLFPKGVLLFDDPSSGFCATLLSCAAYTMKLDIKDSMRHITTDDALINESLNEVFNVMTGRRFDQIVIKDENSTYGIRCEPYDVVDPMMERLLWIDVCHRLLFHPSLSEFRNESKVSYTEIDIKSVMSMIHNQSELVPGMGAQTKNALEDEALQASIQSVLDDIKPLKSNIMKGNEGD